MHAGSAAANQGRLFGIYTGIVEDVKDPDDQGRVKVTLPWSEHAGTRYEIWARLAVPMAGNGRGMWFIPDVGDEVVIAFQGGDPASAVVLGSLWNGKDAPPESMDASGNNDRKVLRSRNGVQITLDDRDGQERFEVETPAGQRLVLKDGPGEVTIEDNNGNSITLTAGGVKVSAAAKVEVAASAVKVSAGLVEVDAGMSRFSGVVQCDTLITNSVVASSYTPGAGNVW
jgi:phage baseplate assembly protein V